MVGRMVDLIRAVLYRSDDVPLPDDLSMEKVVELGGIPQRRYIFPERWDDVLIEWSDDLFTCYEADEVADRIEAVCGVLLSWFVFNRGHSSFLTRKEIERIRCHVEAVTKLAGQLSKRGRAYVDKAVDGHVQAVRAILEKHRTFEGEWMLFDYALRHGCVPISCPPDPAWQPKGIGFDLEKELRLALPKTPRKTISAFSKALQTP